MASSLRSDEASLRSAHACPVPSTFLKGEESAGYTIFQQRCTVRTAVSSTFGVCRREAWCDFALRGLSKRLFVGAVVRWRFCGESSICEWHGTVVSARDQRSWWVRYKEPRHQYVFPPVDPSVRVLTISAQLHRIKPERTQLVPVGHRIRVSFARTNCRGSMFTLLGTVVAHLHGERILVRYDDNKTFMLPPPPTSNLRVCTVSSFSRPPLGMRQQSLRYRRAAASVCATVVAHSTAEPCLSAVFRGTLASASCVSTCGQEKHAQQQQGLSPQCRRPSTSQGISIMSLNVRTLTDRAKLLTLCGFAERNCVHVVAIQETRTTLGCELQSQVLEAGWEWHSISADASGGGGVGVLLCPSIAASVISVECVAQARAIKICFKTFNFLCIYAPTAPCSNEQEAFFHDIGSSILAAPELPWIVAGDFNAALSGSRSVSSDGASCILRQFLER